VVDSQGDRPNARDAVCRLNVMPETAPNISPESSLLTLCEMSPRLSMPIIVIWLSKRINYRARSPALIDLRQEPRNAMETVFPLGVND
jgi:hypothetical protein